MSPLVKIDGWFKLSVMKKIVYKKRFWLMFPSQCGARQTFAAQCTLTCTFKWGVSRLRVSVCLFVNSAGMDSLTPLAGLRRQCQLECHPCFRRGTWPARPPRCTPCAPRRWTPLRWWCRAAWCVRKSWSSGYPSAEIWPKFALYFNCADSLKKLAFKNIFDKDNNFIFLEVVNQRANILFQQIHIS